MNSTPWPSGARAILHVDMDAFYAALEQRENPALRGRPVIVGGPRDARGVVSAASYEARRYGVHSAQPLREAARRCPGGVFLPVRMKLYLEASRQLFALLEHYSPLVEPLSVDEAFLDLTGSERLFGGPVAAAEAIRREIRATLRITASVGVAPNKFVAKIASDLKKPDGLVVVPPGTVQDFLAPLPVERMWGIGPRGARALHALAITTFGELAAAPLERLRPLFGAGSPALLDLAVGRDTRAVVTTHAPKSVGNETTFPHDVRDEDVLHATLVALADRVAGRLRRHGLRAGCVTLKVRYAPFRTITRRLTLPEPTCRTGSLLRAVRRLYEERTPGGSTPVRLLGVSTSAFSGQTTLFPEPGAERAGALDAAVDRVRDRFGAAALRRASVLESGRR